MRVLLDSHLLVWLSAQTTKLPAEARRIIEDGENLLFFSSASIWELVVKHALARGDIPVHPRVLYQAMKANGFEELVVTGEHTFMLEALPTLHKDPFDRILIAQAKAEGMMLLTSDQMLGRYGEPVRLVR